MHESLHPGFGVDLVNQVRAETDAWTADFESEIVGLIREAVEDDPALSPRAAMPFGIGSKRYISPVISSGMEASRLTVSGENVDQLAETLIESKATTSARSLNKRGARNVHRYDGDGFTQYTYERAAAYENSWLMVSVLVERVDDETATVVVFVGGGGEGPFKLEEISSRRIFKGEEAVGETGRFETVLRDVRGACESLDLDVETEWESDTEQRLGVTVAKKIFDS